MKRLRITIVLFLAVLSAATAQKKPLDHSVYDMWQSFSAASISDNGKWVTYEINPQEGDGWLYFFDVSTGRKDSVSCGYKAEISSGSEYAAFMVKPAFNVSREAKKKKLTGDKAPKENLGIKIFSTGEIKIIERVKSFSLPESGSPWMAYLMEKKESKAEAAKDNKEEKSSQEGKDEMQQRPVAGRRPAADGPLGSDLVILNPITGKEHRFPDVTEFIVAKDGGSIGFVQAVADSLKVENYKVSFFTTKNELTQQIFEGKGSVKKITADNPGLKYSFIYSADTAKIKIYGLYLWNGKGMAASVAGAGNQAFPDGFCPSENGSLTFSDDGMKLYFGTAKTPVKEPEDTLLDDEKYHLDIWSWDDATLQPMQKKQLAMESRKTFTAVYHIKIAKLVQLGSEELPNIRTLNKGNSDIALGVSNLKYMKEGSWNSNGKSDYYSVNLLTGEKKMLLEGASGQVSLSPMGKSVIFWSNAEKAWFSMPITGGPVKNITSSIEVPLFNEEHDTPDEPRPHGIAGWIEGERYVMINDRYDIWMVDVTGMEKAVNLTSGFGRKNNLRLRYNDFEAAGGRFSRGGRDADPIGKKDKIYLSSFDYLSKEAGFYRLPIDKPGSVEKLFTDKISVRFTSKAKETGAILFSKETVENSPNLYIGDADFKNARKITDTNPQQASYNWATVEIVEWESFWGDKLQGLLYKPENFDPSKKYPMIVYFYEKSSDGLYSYNTPAPSASTVNRIYAVSNGYLVFVPDIPYREGYPGESCYNSVVSGTHALLERYKWIDRTKLGLDGQSWGGYQIAWLVTKTDLFACAFSGAPVVNMTSAYGGIRWGTGMSRMFQYENTQSRIGGTLWDRPFHYIENSAIFYVPKINTPLLIMANDEDGAVPWYQGIEFITSLRRLEKPAWLLVYNGEDHNLTKRPNRKDLSVRKMQFFDHYLMDAPMPYWMKNGISQTEKGKTDGYELMK